MDRSPVSRRFTDCLKDLIIAKLILNRNTSLRVEEEFFYI
jgi:hypothetical protein